MIETANWEEVSKAKATKIFNNYGFVYALASKLNPENPWWGPSLINTEAFNHIDGFISSYKYYNCNKETGMGIRFYVRKERPQVTPSSIMLDADEMEKLYQVKKDWTAVYAAMNMD